MNTTKSTWTIRAATPEDSEVRREITFNAWADAYSNIFTPQEIAGLYNGQLKQSSDWTTEGSETIDGLVAEAKGKIIGHVGLALLGEGQGEVTSLYVLPAHQGQGAGLGLWTAGCQVLRERGCQEAEVWVLARARAVGFYNRIGLKRFDESLYRIGDHAERALGYRLEL